MGGGPPTEDPIPVDVNPRPLSHNPNSHPNQLNHFPGLIQQHQTPDVLNNVQEANHQHMPLDNATMNKEQDEYAMPGWGHWEMPNDDQEDDEFIDQELEDGEFLELADWMQHFDGPAQEEDLAEMDN